MMLFTQHARPLKKALSLVVVLHFFMQPKRLMVLKAQMMTKMLVLISFAAQSKRQFVRSVKMQAMKAV